MARTALKVAIVDAVLLAGIYSVFLDLQARTAKAESLHGACPSLCSYAPSFSYNLLTQFFTMAGNGATLTSPPTLDWVQLLAYALVAVNAWFIYTLLAKRRAKSLTPSNPSVPPQ